MAASIGVLDAQLDSRIELVNEPRRGERRSLRNDNCALAGRRSGPCGPRKKISRQFSKTLSSPAVLFPDVFFTGRCGFRFAEERRTFADMWTSLDTLSFRAACVQKCLWQQFWAFFYTSLWRARTVGPVFPAVLFPVAFLDFVCTDRQVSSRKRDRACWSSELYVGFVSTKEKLVCSYKTIHGEKVKNDQKTLCRCHRISGYDEISIHNFDPMEKRTYLHGACVSVSKMKDHAYIAFVCVGDTLYHA